MKRILTLLKRAATRKSFFYSLPCVVFLINIFTIFIYLFNYKQVLDFFPNKQISNPVTAVCFILGCISFSLVVSRKGIINLVGRYLGLLVLLTGLTRIVEIFLHYTTGIDRWLFKGELEQYGINGLANYMAPNTAFGLILLGSSLAMYTSKFKKNNAIGERIALAGLILSLLPLVGHFYKDFDLYYIKNFTPMAFPTAISFFLLLIGIVSYRFKHGIFKVFTKNYQGSKMARVFLPFAILVPFTTGLIRLYGEKIHLYNTNYGIALFFIMNVVVFVLLIWRYSYVLNASSISLIKEVQQTWRLKQQLILINKDLEERIETRSQELFNEKNKTLFLEKQLLETRVLQQKELMRASVEGQEIEKKRIGMELHDNVNQILTSTKLYIEMSLSHKEFRSDMLQKSKEQISIAIDEIRSLSQILVAPSNDLSGILNSIEDVLDSFQQTSGFRIRKNINKEVFDKLDEDRQIAVFRIIQEQMNNILKHSAAEYVELSLKKTGNQVVLHIEDDGKGFDLSSIKNGIGLTNIRNRVEALDGSLMMYSAPGNGFQLTVVFS